MKYPVFYNGNAVGSVNTQHNGLYTRIQCTCNLPDHEIYRLIATCDRGSIDCGICIPGKIQIEKSFATKCFGNGITNFSLHKNIAEKCDCTVEADQPFSYVAHLTQARLVGISNIDGRKCAQLSISNPLGGKGIEE